MAQDNRTELELATEGLVRGSDGNVYPMPDTGQAPYDPYTDLIGTVLLPIAAGFAGSAIGITGLLGGGAAVHGGGAAVRGGGGAAVRGGGGAAVRGGGGAVGGGGVGGFIKNFFGDKAKDTVTNRDKGRKKDKKKKESKEEQFQQQEQQIQPTAALVPAIKNRKVQTASSVEDVQPTIITGTPTFSDIIKQCVTIDEQVIAINKVVQIDYNNRKTNLDAIKKQKDDSEFSEREGKSESKTGIFGNIGSKISGYKKQVESNLFDIFKNISFAALFASIHPMWESYTEEPLRVVRDSFRAINTEFINRSLFGKNWNRLGISLKRSETVSAKVFNSITKISKNVVLRIKELITGTTRASTSVVQEGVSSSVRGASSAATRPGVAPQTPRSGRLLGPNGRPLPPSTAGTTRARAPGVPSASSAASRNATAQATVRSSVGTRISSTASKFLSPKGVQRLTGIAKNFRRIPLIGSLLGIGIDLLLGVPIVEALVGAVGYSIGYTLGSVAGTVIGTAVGSVVPFIGNIIGGAAGKIIGGMIGGFIGDWLAKKLWRSIKGVQQVDDIKAPPNSFSPTERRPGTFTYMYDENGNLITDENGRPILGVMRPDGTITEATPAELQIYAGGANNIDSSGGKTYSPTGIQKEMFNYLTKEKGLSPEQAMGILANINRESSFNLTAVGDNGTSFGLFQWHAERGDGMKSAVPDWETNWRGQIDYALSEPGEPGPEFISTNFSSAQEAADWWMNEWERPSDPAGGSRNHESYLSGITNSSITSGDDVQVTPSQPMSSLPPLPPTGTMGTGSQAYGASRGGGTRSHAGVDFDISGNEPFYTRLGGEVINIGYNPGGYGHYVDILTPQGVVERIAEGAEVLVSVGQILNPGDPVVRGESETGVIHYEIRTDGGGFGYSGTIDPLKYLRDVNSDQSSSGETVSKISPTTPPSSLSESSNAKKSRDLMTSVLSQYEEDEDIIVPIPMQQSNPQPSGGGSNGSAPSLSGGSLYSQYFKKKMIGSLY